MTATQNTLLRQAFIQVYAEEYEMLATTNIEDNFSEKFEKKIQKLINNLDSYWTYVNRNTKRFLTVLVAAVLLLVGSMSVTAFRETILDFVANVYETFTEVFHKDEESANNEVITTFYSLGYVPEGYTEVNSNISEIFVSQEFQNRENGYLVFEQMPLGYNITIDTESTMYQEIQLANINALISSNKGQDVIVWRDEQYFYTLTCTPSPGLLEIEKIIEGVIELSN